VEARSRLGTERRGATTVAAVLRSEAPLLLRAANRGDLLEVHLVGGAAGPLGGDDLRLDLDVAAGSDLRVRSVAAQLAQPDPHGRSSAATTTARIASGAHIDWQPEPLISVAGSDHRATTELHVDAGASLRWVDTIVLGRIGEQPGVLASRLRVVLAGRVVLDHDLVTGSPGLDGPGANGRARTLTSTVLIGPDAPHVPSSTVARSGAFAGVFPLAAGAALLVTLAPRRASIGTDRSVESVNGA
jgi:urease accessory protein